MSMLTPPGKGGQFRITGDKYPRMRRSRRGRIVLAVIGAAALALASWGTFQLIGVFSGDGERRTVAADRTDCKPDKSPAPAEPPKPLPKPDRITVNVLNATPRSGLAQRTADELKKRGFTIGKVGNATKEYDKKVKGAAVLLGPKTAEDTAMPVLATQLKGAEHRTDGRKGQEIDLIIGTAFKELTKKAEADKAIKALTNPKPNPSDPASGKKNC
ncbi:LytR C-terminal domain-containing protein [Streptomyces sp. NPDC002851]